MRTTTRVDTAAGGPVDHLAGDRFAHRQLVHPANPSGPSGERRYQSRRRAIGDGRTCQAGRRRRGGSGGPRDGTSACAGSERGAVARFDLAPPRRFLFPAVLLLLADEPGYGYRLVKELEGFRFGADRSAERVPHAGPARARRARRVVVRRRHVGPVAAAVPDRPRRASAPLRVWMGVIKEERDRLDAVLRRYAVVGRRRRRAGRCRGRLGRRAHGPPMSPVSPTDRATAAPAEPAGPPATRGAAERDPATLQRARFAVLAERSAVLVEARSTVGPLTFGVMGLPRHHRHAAPRRAGLRRRTRDGHDRHPGRRAAVGQRDLRRRAPRGASTPAASRSSRCTCDGCAPGGAPDRYRVASDVTIHGVTRRLEGTVVVSAARPRPSCR